MLFKRKSADYFFNIAASIGLLSVILSLFYEMPVFPIKENEKQTFFERYHSIIFGFSVLLVILFMFVLFFIFFLVWSIYKRNQTIDQSQQQNEILELETTSSTIIEHL